MEKIAWRNKDIGRRLSSREWDTEIGSKMSIKSLEKEMTKVS